MALFRQTGLGISFSRDHVQAAEVAWTVGGPVLIRCAEEPIMNTIDSRGDAAPLASVRTEAIVRCLKKMGISASERKVVGVIPAGTSTVRYFQMPFVPREELNRAVIYEAVQYLPFKLSEIHYDYQMVEISQGGEKSLGIVFGAGRLSDINYFVQSFYSAHLRIISLEPIYGCLVRSLLASGQVKPAEKVLLIHIENQGELSLVVSQRHIFYLCRDFQLPLTTPEETDQKFVVEIRGSMKYAFKLSGDDQWDKVFISGHGDLVHWQKLLNEHFPEVKQVLLANFPVAKDLTAVNTLPYAAAIGAGLRGIRWGSPFLSLQLLPPQTAISLKEQLQRLFLVTSAAGFALFFIIYLLFQPGLAGLRKQLDRKQNERMSINPELAKLSDKQLMERRDALARHLSFSKGFSNHYHPVYEKWVSLSKIMPGGSWITKLDFKNRGSDVRLNKAGLQMILEGMIYMADAGNELRAANAMAGSLKNDSVFAKGFDVIVLDKAERAEFLGRPVTRFRIICSGR